MEKSEERVSRRVHAAAAAAAARSRAIGSMLVDVAVQVARSVSFLLVK